jgi:hypothetical protein
MIATFQRVFGFPYPYPKYAQSTVADFTWGGMENTSATTLMERVLHSGNDSFEERYDSLISHELAHQWWGDLVTCRDWSEGWLNEGFATYSEIVFREADEGRDDADYARLEQMCSYLTEDRAIAAARRDAMNHPRCSSTGISTRGGLFSTCSTRSGGRGLAPPAQAIPGAARVRIGGALSPSAFEEETGEISPVLRPVGLPVAILAQDHALVGRGRALVLIIEQVQEVDAVTPLFRFRWRWRSRAREAVPHPLDLRGRRRRSTFRSGRPAVALDPEHDSRPRLRPVGRGLSASADPRSPSSGFARARVRPAGTSV